MYRYIDRYTRSLFEYRPLKHSFSIKDLNFNSENTATVNLQYCPKTTAMIDQFLKEERSYLILEEVFMYSLPAVQEWPVISLICTPIKRSHPAVHRGNLPSLSLLKQATIHQDDFAYPIVKRLHPIALSIIKILKQNAYKRGRYLIDEPEAFKAQCSSDRYGFRKEWRGTDIVYEWNYGDCSMYFAVIGFRT